RDDSNARLVDDTASRHPDNGFGQDLLFWVSRSMHAKNGTDAKDTSVTIFAYSAQRFFGTRSRTGALRDDKVSGFRGSLYWMVIRRN
ncbi:hypothetical protein, partial [Mesotoga sp.]|uniref:hypothetical protein n=1 Tax=Mesotoga sp. TaxID=2053577 RepID=UPI002615D7A2